MPEDWEARRLEEAATIVAGQSPPSEIVSEYLEGQPFLQRNALLTLRGLHRHVFLESEISEGLP